MKKLYAVLSVSYVFIMANIATAQASPLTCDQLRNNSQDTTKSITFRLEALKKYRVKCLGVSPIAATNDHGSDLNLYTFDSAKANAGTVSTLVNTSTSLQEAVMSTGIEQQNLGAAKDFLGLGLGIGFGVSFYDDKIVEEAEVVNGKVVSVAEKDEEARVLLEFHHLWNVPKWGLGDNWGLGPFAAVSAVDDKVLSGVGVGIMFGFKNRSSDDGSGFNVGLGTIWDNGVKSLADGFKVGADLPEGETDVRYTKRTERSLFVFVTNKF